MLIVLASAKGSPGVSTATLALAATWPQGLRPVILECDPSGGDLGSAYGLQAEPGLLTLASAARRDRRPGLLWSHVQALPGGLEVVPASASAEEANSAVDVLMASAGLSTLDELPPLVPSTNDETDAGTSETNAPVNSASLPEQAAVLVDLGRLPSRLSRGTGAARLLEAADVVLLVVRNHQSGIVHAAARLSALKALTGDDGRRVQVLLVDEDGQGRMRRRRAEGPTGTYAASAVAQALEVAVAGTLPVDRRAAALLAGRPAVRTGNFARMPLMRAAMGIAKSLSLGEVRPDVSTSTSQDGDASPTSLESELSPLWTSLSGFSTRQGAS